MKEILWEYVNLQQMRYILVYAALEKQKSSDWKVNLWWTKKLIRDLT
jgi:hypothetical protein